MTLADLGDYARNALHTVKGLSASQAPARADALIKRVNAVVMLFDDRLYDLRHGNWVSVGQVSVEQPGENPSALRVSAEVISDAAARLLGTVNTDRKNGMGRESRENGTSPQNRHAHNVLLLLPPAEFLAMQVNLPGIAASAVKAALRLQASTMLAAWEKPLSLAAYTGERKDDIQDMALYLPSERLDELFDGFADRGLFLAAVTPRPLILNQQDADTRGSMTVQDSDAQDLTCATFQSGRVTHYLGTALNDLDDEAFANAWQQELAQTMAASPGQDSGSSSQQPSQDSSQELSQELSQALSSNSVSLGSAADYLDAVQRLGSQFHKQICSAYVFCPGGALAVRHQFDRGKRLLRVAAVAAGIAVLSALPFLVQTIQIASLQSSLQAQRELAAPARQNQAVVRDFESEWGVLMAFPRQQVADVLLTLQEVISPSVLVAMEIEDGFISIEGDSADPQNLLQQLEQNPMFTEVDFARATNNNRYYIDLRLTTVNFPAYQEWYFPERR